MHIHTPVHVYVHTRNKPCNRVDLLCFKKGVQLDEGAEQDKGAEGFNFNLIK